MADKRESVQLKLALQELAKYPTAETYARLRSWFVTCPAYDPYREELRDLERMIEVGDFAAAAHALEGALARLLLSPRAHELAAQVALGTGDTHRAEREHRIAQACVEGILNTGDGSQDNPYRVLYSADEQDVLGFLGLPQKAPHLIHIGNRHLDRCEVAEGVEVWFDVTVPYHRQTSATVLEQLEDALRDLK